MVLQVSRRFAHNTRGISLDLDICYIISEVSIDFLKPRAFRRSFTFVFSLLPYTSNLAT